MVKTLLLMRHAKSSWGEPDLPDHDRPLNERGKRDVPRVAQWLADNQLVPQMILSSTAKRARKTAEKLVEATGWDAPIETRRELYLANPNTLVRALSELGSGADCVLLVGHNPGLEEFLARMTGQDQELPTSAVAQIEFAVDDWSELTPETPGECVLLRRPRDLE